MGLFGMAYPLYTMILVLSTAGIPVAISKLVAEQLAENRPQQAGAIFKVANRALVVSGLFFSTLTVRLAYMFTAVGILRDPRALLPFLATSPAVLLVAINSAGRGYFQGFQDMRPTAVSQIVEQFFRAATAVILGYLLLPYGLEFAAAGAALGAVSGAIGAGVVLWWYRRSSAHGLVTAAPWPEDWRRILKRILGLAVPVTLASLVMPIMQNLDVLVVPYRLEAAGYTVAESTALFGQLTQMAFTLVNLPVILTGALAVSLVPAISAAQTRQNRFQLDKYIHTSLRFTILLELPAAVGLYLLAEPIMGLLYGSPEAGPALAALSASCLFLGLNQTTAGILQGLGRTDLPVRSLVAGAAVKVVLTYILTGIPAFGIRGAAWATVATFALASFLNVHFICKQTGFTWVAGDYLPKSAAAAGGMGLIVSFSYRYLAMQIGYHWAVFIAIAVGIISYLILLLLFRAMKAEDLALLGTFGAKLAHRLKPKRR